MLRSRKSPGHFQRLALRPPLPHLALRPPVGRRLASALNDQTQQKGIRIPVGGRSSSQRQNCLQNNSNGKSIEFLPMGHSKLALPQALSRGLGHREQSSNGICFLLLLPSLLPAVQIGHEPGGGWKVLEREREMRNRWRTAQPRVYSSGQENKMEIQARFVRSCPYHPGLSARSRC